MPAYSAGARVAHAGVLGVQSNHTETRIMSQLGNTGVTGPSRRRGDNEPHGLTLGVDQSVAVRDIVPVSEGAKMAFELARSFGMVGDVAGDLADRNRRAAAERRRLEAEAEHAERGQAATNVAEFLPQLQQDIAQDKIHLPDGIAASEFARDYVAQVLAKAGPNVSAAYRDEYTSRAVPAITEALVKRQTQRLDRNRLELGELIRNGATGKSNPDQLRAAAKDYAAKLRVSDQEAVGAIGVHVMGVAARQGDVATFNAAKELLGDSAMAEQTEAAVEMQRTLDRLEGNRNEAFSRDISGMYVRGETFDTIRTRIAGYAGKIDPRLIDARNQEVDQRERETFRRATEAEKQAFMTRERDRIVAETAPMLDAGDSTGGAPFVADREITLPDGSVKTVTREEIISGVRRRKWAQLETELNGRPEAILSAKLDWLGKNPGVTDPAMVAVWSGPRSRVDVGDTDATVQPSLVQAYELFRLAHTISPGVVASQIQDSADYDFFRVAEFLHGNIPDLTPETALATAARRWPRDPAIATRISDELSDTLILEHARDIVKDSANGGQASRIIEQRARAYVIMGLGKEAAVREATKHFKQDHTKVNDFWIYTRGQQIGHVDLDALGRLLVAKYAADAGDQDPRGFALAPDDSQGQAWFITMGDGRFPAPGSPRLSAGDLTQLWAVVQDERASQERTSRTDAQMDDKAARRARATANMAQAGRATEGEMSGGGEFRVPIVPIPAFSEGRPAPRRAAVPDHLKPWAEFIVSEVRKPPPKFRPPMPQIP